MRTRVGNLTAILEVSGKLNLLMNLNRIPLIVLGFFNFHFPIDFIGGQLGGQWGVSRGSVDRGSVFCRNPRIPQKDTSGREAVGLRIL